MNKTRKICVITSAHPVLDQRIFDREILSLKKFGFDVDFIVPSAIKKQQIQGVAVFGLPKRKTLLRFLNWAKILNIVLKNKYDAYHFHDPDLLPIGVLLKWITRKPVVYDAHEHYPDRILLSSNIPGWLRKVLGSIVEVAEEICAKCIHNVVVVDVLQKEHFDRVGCNTLLLYNYAKLSNFPLEVVRRNYDDKTIVHVGTLSVERGSLVLLDVISKINAIRSEIKFIVVDRFFSVKEKAVWQEKLAQMGETKNLEIVPQVAPSKMSEIVSKGVIGILLELPGIGQNDKSLATRLYEYMACGLVIIDRNSFLQKELILKNNCGVLVDVENTQEVVSAIFDLIDHPEVMKEKGGNGRRLFEQQFNWEVLEPGFRDFYNALFMRERAGKNV